MRNVCCKTCCFSAKCLVIGPDALFKELFMETPSEKAVKQLVKVADECPGNPNREFGRGCVFPKDV